MNPDFLNALAGGALIGLAASALLLMNGRVAGISGIFAGLLAPSAGDIDWRAGFVGGLLLSGVVAVVWAPSLMVSPAGRSLFEVGLAGLLVGFGVRLGNGCTSGHGVCGLSRLSRRSLVATVTFICTGVLAVAAANLTGAGS